MTNKTIALREISLPDRLGYARKIANGETVKYLGLTVTNEPVSAKDKADALAAMPASYRLAAARAGHSMPKAANEPTEQAGFFDGTGFVTFDDSIGVA